MRALVFRHDLVREVVTAVAGRVDVRAHTGRLAPVALEDVPEPVPPGPRWVRCRTVLSGICGSDTKQVLLNGARDNPLTAVVSFPHVLGHEAVARREDNGERVVVDPWLGCGPRGIEPPCPACAAGRYPACRNFTRGLLDAGLHLGNCGSVPGTHADAFVAHEEQLHVVPPELPDEVAVLADPASVSLRSVLLAPPDPSRPALVYGSGALAFAAVAWLRHLFPDVEVWAATRPGPRARLAARLGAHAVLDSRPEALVAEVARRSGARLLVPWSGRPWVQDGPGVVYDTIGSPETLETASRLAGTGATVVVSGVEPPRRFEWTLVYFKELRVIGSNAFGVEELRARRAHAFEHYFAAAAAGLDLSPLVTHRFPLAAWRDAFLVAARSRSTGSVKVLLVP